MLPHFIDQIVPFFKQFYIANGIEQPFPQEPFSHRRGGFIDKFKQSHLIGIAGDNPQLFGGIVPNPKCITQNPASEPSYFFYGLRMLDEMYELLLLDLVYDP